MINRPQAVRSALPPLHTSTSNFQYLGNTIRSVSEQEREFIANASHELLSPISILHNRVENMLQAESLPEEAELQLVSSRKNHAAPPATLLTLLHISRVENGQYPRTEQVPIALLLAEALEDLEDRLLGRGLTVQRQLTAAPAVANANRTLLFTLLTTCSASNAVKYNEPNGRITIQGETHHGRAAAARIRTLPAGKTSAASMATGWNWR